MEGCSAIHFEPEFWKACGKELDTLENDVTAWKYMKCMPDMKVLPSAWTFKIKCYPDHTIKKFKAHFYFRGDHQEHGVKFWKIWTPVVQWLTSCTVMVMATKEGWVSSQCDITADGLSSQVSHATR